MDIDGRASGRAGAWRSLLFVPATADRYVEKAETTNADAVIIDLEDAVLARDKEVARARVANIAKRLRRPRRDVVVRINRPLSLAVRDLEAVVGAEVDAVMVAKVAGADHLGLLSEVITLREAELGLRNGRTALIPLVETAEAISSLHEICLAERVTAIVCGDEDLATELGCSPLSELITNVKYQLLLAASRAAIHPLGLIGTIAEFRDLVAYQGYLDRSRAAGLRGTLCIHPAQVEPANKAFFPTEAEIEHAKRVVRAATQAEEKGDAVVALDGSMIDAPILLRARRTLSRIN
jgi:citrate lyase subunit beta/citryl-CoA lyase